MSPSDGKGRDPGGVVLSVRIAGAPSSRRELLQALLAWVAAVRQSPGVDGAGASEDVEAEAVFEVWAQWDTEDALEAHLRSDSFGVLVGAADVLGLSVRLSVARVTDEFGLDVIRKRREALRAEAQGRRQA